jgi:hypothetical protein
MWDGHLLIQLIAIALALIQLCLSLVLGYRAYLQHQFTKGVPETHKRTATLILKVHRMAIFIMTFLQLVRVIDPFSVYYIWPYPFARFLQATVTICVYFEYGSTTYIIMDTLYACALKRTPKWLAYIVIVLPITQTFVGYGVFIGEYTVGKQWVNSITQLYAAFVLFSNVITYNVCGCILIRLLRKHELGEATNSDNDLSDSKPASPFGVVMTRTLRSMLILSLPSIACGFIVLNDGINYMNNNPVVQFGPGPNQKPDRPTITVIFLQFGLGILFTRIGWISKTQLKLLSKSGSRPSSASNTVVSESDKRTGGKGSKADLKERAQRLSVSPGKVTRGLADNLQVEMLKNADRPSSSCGSTSSGVELASTPPLCSREMEHRRDSREMEHDSAPFSVVVLADAEDQRPSAIVPESEVSRFTDEGISFPPSTEVSRSEGSSSDPIDVV